MSAPEIPAEPDGAEALEALERENRDKEKLQRRELNKRFGNYGFIVMPSDAEAPILNPPVRATLFEWLYEMNLEDELKRVGLKPRKRALLTGPPGCGKTTLAHHISARLGVPMVVLQSHAIVSKYLSASGENLGRLFREARRDAYGLALFFDEFDSLAQDRARLGDQGADNERQSITNALLQEMDRYEGLLFAASNVSAKIDPAIWRRFELQITIGLPGSEERRAIVRLYLRPFEPADGLVEYLAEVFDGASPALIRTCCEYIKRVLVLGPRMNLSTLLPDVLRRMLISIEPPEELEPPELWRNTLQHVANSRAVPWPPGMP